MPRKAYNEVAIVEKFPSKVESLVIWSERIIAGTDSGAIIWYDVLPREMGTGGYQVHIKPFLRGFAKKAIMQLHIIRETSKSPILLSLSDSSVHVHGLPNFNFVETIKGSRNATLFAVDESTRSVLLALAIKKKIVLFTLTQSGFIPSREFNIGDVARSMAWCNGNLCIGCKSKYILLDMSTMSVKDIYGAGALPRGSIPCVSALPDKFFLAIDKNLGVVHDYNGNSTKSPGINWSDVPESVVYDSPFLIGVLRSGAVEIQSLVEGSRSQVQQLPLRVKFLAKKGKTIYVASAKEIWKLDPVPFVEQIENLVAMKSYDEALLLLDQSVGEDEEKVEKIRNIKYLCANHLFEKDQYKSAMKLFIELNCNPQKVLRLYPDMLPRSMQDNAVRRPTKEGGYSEVASLHALIYYLDCVRDPDVDTPPNKLLDDFEYSEDLNEIIDTAMLRACIQTSDATIYKLLGGKNRCNLKESIKMLTDAERTPDLVKLYKSKGMHQKALDILTNLGKKRGTGTGELIEYLKTLGKSNLDLILKYSIWALEETPADGIEIFMEERSAEHELPPTEVLRHIKQISAAKRITVPYLEWLINECGKTNQDFHNELILEYLNKVVDLKKKLGPSTTIIRAGEEKGKLGAIRRLLVDFLERSTSYAPEKLLPTFMYNDLYEERAILLSRLKKHKEALHTYVHQLGDCALAEAYCDRFYDANEVECRDVYLSLLSVYLEPPAEHSILLEPALKLLGKHYSAINAAEALYLLPSDMPIHEIYGYFQATLRHMAEKKRNSQVISKLLRSENLQVRQVMIQETSPPINIDEDTDCPVCGRSITGTSAFAHYPNGTVVHYGCCKDPHVCPKTNTRFGPPKNE